MTAAVSATELNILFPFQIVATFDLTIIAVGPSLAKICPSVKVGRGLHECIRVVRPAMRIELSVLRSRLRSILLIQTLAEKIDLRGQHMIDDEHGIIVFAVVPRLFEVNDIEKLGLSVRDFASSDPVLDFLLVLQTKDTILNDALALNASLEARQQSLENARMELVSEIEERMRGEEALRIANEDLSARLTTIVEQQRLIARMSVPVIHVWEGIVTLPVVGIIDEDRIQRFAPQAVREPLRACCDRPGPEDPCRDQG